MFIIVISHVTQTLGTATNTHYAVDYVINYEMASTDIQSLLLAWMGSFGSQGNLLFFTCSAWFLLDSKDINCRKMAYMIADVWIVNVAILAVLVIGGWFLIDTKNIIKSFFPTTLALNWYITCYILFYLIHTKLNLIIKNCTQKELLKMNLIALFLYYGVNYIKNGHFFPSNLILFVVIYFSIAYSKLYLPTFGTNKKVNCMLFAFGLAGTPVMILFTNFLGLHISFFADKLTHWGNDNTSPFMLLAAVAALNLARGWKLVSPAINKISSLSLLVYIIHENLLVRTYIRPMVWSFIHNTFGYDYVVLWVLLQAAGYFAISLGLSALYQVTLQKRVHKVSSMLYGYAASIYEKISDNMIKIK